jgi:C1A family cysteine protease
MTLGAVAVLIASGCGQVGMNAVNAVGNTGVAAQAAAHKLGYNVTRFKQTLSRSFHGQHLTRRAALPASVDNRQYCAPVYDQGQLGSCTAFSMGKGLREYMQRKNGEKQVPLSALDLYYYERLNMGQEYVNQDSGANMVDGMTVLANRGVATDESWPYKISIFKTKPSAAADATAADWKIKKAVPLASFEDVKTAIANGQPVAFGFLVYNNFFRIGSDGMMPMPKGSAVGGHAVLAVGYDDEKKALIVRNSWGGSWGAKGYFYMPYDFAKNPEQTMEFFTAE